MYDEEADETFSKSLAQHVIPKQFFEHEKPHCLFATFIKFNALSYSVRTLFTDLFIISQRHSTQIDDIYISCIDSEKQSCSRYSSERKDRRFSILSFPCISIYSNSTLKNRENNSSVLVSSACSYCTITLIQKSSLFFVSVSILRHSFCFYDFFFYSINHLFACSRHLEHREPSRELGNVVNYTVMGEK